MKVLHVITGFTQGGAETMLAKLLGALRGQVQTRVVSLTGDGPIGERIRALGVETVALGMRRGVPDPRAILALARQMRGYRPDVVQTWLYHADLLGGLASLLAGRPPVLWGIRNADLDETTAKWSTLQTLRACAWLSHRLPARIVSCSERAREFHVARGYDAGKMVVIPNGFDLVAFAPRPEAREEVRRELGIPLEAPMVGMVARYHPMKDFGNFAQAAGLLARELPAVRFLLCGDGVTPENAELCGWLRAAGALERTHLLGRRDDVPRLLAALDLFTLSSATEGFPNALGEAMACGVPCVATDVGDSGYVLGDAGSIVPPRDHRALARGWRETLARSAQAPLAAGARGRSRILDHFGLRAVSERFLDLYGEVSRAGPGR